MLAYKLTGVFFFSSRRRHTRLQGDWSSTCALPILAVYLVTFILAFEMPGLYGRWVVARFMAVMLAGLGFALSKMDMSLPVGLGVGCGVCLGGWVRGAGPRGGGVIFFFFFVGGGGGGGGCFLGGKSRHFFL